jgi:hypothetical protein
MRNLEQHLANPLLLPAVRAAAKRGLAMTKKYEELCMESTLAQVATRAYISLSPGMH